MEITRVGYGADHGIKEVIPANSVDSAGWKVSGDILQFVTGKLPNPSNANNHHEYTISISFSDILRFMAHIAQDADPDVVSAHMAEIRTWTGPDFMKDYDDDTKTLFGSPPPPDLQRMLAWWLAIASGYRVV